MKDLLLVNLRGNLQIIVQVIFSYSRMCLEFNFCKFITSIFFQTAKEYSDQLGVDACIKLFEQFKSYEGLYFFLGSYLSSRYMVRLICYGLVLCEHENADLFLFSFYCNETVKTRIYTSSILRQQQKLDS